MVDTITLQFNFYGNRNAEIHKRIKDNEITGFHYIPKNYEERGILSYCAGVAPFGLFYNATHRYINITINPSLILKHYPVADEYVVIENACKKVISDDLHIPQNYVESIVLNRIDFNMDYRIYDEEERNIIYNLMIKTRDKLGKVVKTKFNTAITYLPDTGYVETITYDKEMEHILNFRYDDYEYVENLDNFKGIFRTEVRIKNRKLNQNKSWGLSKELFNYLCEDMKAYYWKQYAEKIWFTEDFYRIDVAVKMIKQNDTLTEVTKSKLIEVLKRINKYGFTKARKYYAELKRSKQIEIAKNKGASIEKLKTIVNKKLCSQDYATFNNYIKRIRALGINPLCYDRKFELAKISNFAKYFPSIH